MNYFSQPLTQKISINKIYSHFTRCLEEDFCFTGEVHDFPELVYVHSGRIGVTAEKNVYELGKGSAILHKAGEFHAIRSVCGTSPVVTIMSFSTEPKIVSAVFDVTPRQKLLLEMISEKLSGGESKVCGNDCFFDNNLSDTDSQIVKNLLEVFLLYTDYSQKITPSASPRDLAFSQAVLFLQENICAPLSVEIVCQKLSIGKTYLKNLFKEYTGMGIMHYFLLLKLKESARLLKLGMPIGEISDKMGFSSQNYFSYVFKKEYSLTPSEYRESCKIKWPK